MVAEAKRGPAFGVLDEEVPYLVPVRIALMLSTMGTPWRFRTKCNLWAYAGLAGRHAHPSPSTRSPMGVLAGGAEPGVVTRGLITRLQSGPQECLQGRRHYVAIWTSGPIHGHATAECSSVVDAAMSSAV